jgi:hypothetical protein
MFLSLFAMLLIPCILLVVVLGFVTLNRYITYKERVALAQLGFSIEDLNRETATRRHGNRGVLWGGVITAMSGLALLLGLGTLGMGAWLLGGLLPLFVGLGMVLIYFLTLGPAPSEEGKGEAPHAGENAASLSAALEILAQNPDQAPTPQSSDHPER